MFLYLKKENKTLELKFSPINNQFLIGRSPESDLLIEEKFVSRKHCFLERLGNQVSIQILSKTPTMLNGKQITKKEELKDQDIISINDIDMVFQVQKENSDKIEDWSCEKVIEWLNSENLGEVKENFKENDINGLVLLTLRGDDFKDMNITKLGIRRKLELAIESLREKDSKKRKIQEEIDQSKKVKIEEKVQTQPKLNNSPSQDLLFSDNIQDNSENFENQIYKEDTYKTDKLENKTPTKEEKDHSTVDLNDPDYLFALQMQPKTCPICFDDFEYDSMMPLSNCKHEFCHDCISKYFIMKITEKGFPIGCPQCKQEVSVLDLELNIEPKYVDLFHEFSLAFLIETNQKSYSCCPTPDCGYLFFFTPGDSTDFKCELCKKRYCLKCKVDFHVGSTCEQYEKWAIENGLADELFTEFISGSKFKKCPGCQRFVEKNHGCNHMTCRCRAEFCYKCGRFYPNECDTSCRGTESQERYEEDEEDEEY